MLLHNLSAEDARERDYVKTLLHRIYAHAMPLRPFMRRCLQHIVCRAGTEDERVHGLSELLEVLGSIINGFVVPLKSTHVDILLQRVLLPLHKLHHLAVFHPQLSYAIMQFLEHDPTLANCILTAILKYWPRQNSKKEVLLLTEIDDILQRLPAVEPRPVHGQQRCAGSVTAEPVPPSPPVTLPTDSLHWSVVEAVVGRVCACAHSPHVAVCEKALSMLSGELLRKFIFFDPTAARDWRTHLVPIIARTVYSNTQLPLTNTLLATTHAQRPAGNNTHRSKPSTTSSSTPTVPVKGAGGRAPPALAPARPVVLGHWNPTICELTTTLANELVAHDAHLIASELTAASKQQQQQQCKLELPSSERNLAAALAAVTLTHSPS